IKQTWQRVYGELPLFAGVGLLFIFVQVFTTQLPLIGGILSWPLTVGLFRLIHVLDRQGELEISAFFWPFMDKQRLLRILVVGWWQTFLIILGFLLLLIPGVWLSVAVVFVMPYFALSPRQGEKWDEAIRWSMRKVKAIGWWRVFGLLLVVGLLNLLGFLALGFGLLITIPMSLLTIIRVVERELAKESEGHVVLR
ncbi:MAG: hypothetical protein N2Z70_06975, partial [Bdellovibrionaceae bacterium]|nr:hypothetical protein [Pseudobdellovibrionaceae bacterium]